MSDMKEVDATEHVSAQDNIKERVDENTSEGCEVLDQKRSDPMPSKQEEEAAIKKKYGGILPRKQPLISKDHERAFFDSADWALGKQGAGKPKGPLEALRPKLQPTPQQQLRARRPVYASADSEGSADSEDGGNAASDDANDNINE